MGVFDSSHGRTGRINYSIWRNGVWLTRLAAVLALLIVVFAFIDIHLLVTPVAETFGALSIVGGIVGIALCLYGVNRRSRRLRSRGFWTSLVAGVVLIAAVGTLYLRAFRTPYQATTTTETEAP